MGGKPAVGMYLEMSESDFFPQTEFQAVPSNTIRHEPGSMPPTRQPSVISSIASGKASWPAHTICPESVEGKTLWCRERTPVPGSRWRTRIVKGLEKHFPSHQKCKLKGPSYLPVPASPRVLNRRTYSCDQLEPCLLGCPLVA